VGSYRSQPIIPVIWTEPDYQGLSHLFVEGDWGGTGIAPRLGNNSNVVANLTRDKDDSFTNLRMIGSAFIDVMIIKGLNFKSTIGGTWFNGYDMNYTMKNYENSENTATSALNEHSYYVTTGSGQTQLTFDKVFGQHKIATIAGYEA
jgi:hypothetical protein